MTALPTDELAKRTYFWERVRAPFTGVIEGLWQPGASVLLLIAIRYFEAPLWVKSILSASGFIGFLLTPLVLSLLSRSHKDSTWLMAALMRTSAFLLLAASFSTGLLAFCALTVLAHVILVQHVPMYTAMYSSHFTTQQRGKRISSVFLLSGVVSVLTSLMVSWALGIDLEHFRIFFGIVALAAFFSSVCIVRIPSEPLDHKQLGNPWHNISLAWKDRLFGWILSSWMLLGLGNLMTLPLRTEYMADPRYGIEASNSQILLITATVPMICKLLATRIWGRLFDHWNLAHLRMLLNSMFMLSLLFFFCSKNLWLLGLGMALLGTAMAGGRIAWSLWVTKIAPSEKSSAYMSVHMLCTGLRGSLAPFLGYLLLSRFAPVQVAYAGVAFIVVSTLMFMLSIRHLELRGKELQAQPIAS